MAANAETPICPTAACKRSQLCRALLGAGVLGLALVAAEGYRVMFGPNWHIVVPGRIYRCAQPNAESLERMIAEEGIRTVINLRGSCDPLDWYVEEARATHQHNISQHDICFSAGRLPSVAEVRRLLEALECSEYPIVLHCRRGADRTGMAAAMALLSTTNTPLEEAFLQLGWRYGHVAVGRPAQLDQFLAFYKSWLTAEGKTHTNDTFRHWALHCYRPGSCWSELTLLTRPPGVVCAGDPTTFRIRVHNSSLLPWHLGPQMLAGVHLGCHIYDIEDRLVDVVKAGLCDAEVRPGKSMDFTVAVPPLHHAGRYLLNVDMVDEQQCWFFQTGSQPLELELIVRE